MTKNFLIALIAGLLVIAVGAILWSMRAAPVATGPALPEFDYAGETSWAVRPARTPPAVWETGWEIDVIVLASGDAVETSSSVAIEKRRDDAAETIAKVSAAFETIGPVYAPYLRASDVNNDIAAALTQYLSTDNRGRAFVIATDAPLPEALATVFASDPLIRDRFGGVLIYGGAASTDFEADVTAPAFCSRRHTPEAPCVVPVDLRRVGGKYELKGHEPLTSGFVAWLKDHASKLAEPLGALEEIEIIEIQRPPEPE